MRRCLSSLLMLAMLATAAAPLLAAQPSALHACCLRGGKHHCSGGSGQDGFKSQASSCPYNRSFALSVSPVALAGSTYALAVILDDQDTAQVSITANRQHSEHAVSLRGPPLS